MKITNIIYKNYVDKEITVTDVPYDNHEYHGLVINSNVLHHLLKQVEEMRKEGIGTAKFNESVLKRHLVLKSRENTEIVYKDHVAGNITVLNVPYRLYKEIDELHLDGSVAFNLAKQITDMKNNDIKVLEYEQ